MNRLNTEYLSNMEKPFKDDTLLARWLSGEVSDEERIQIESHPDFEIWQRLIDQANHLDIPTWDDENLWEKINLNRTQYRKTRNRKRLLRWTSGVAALLLISFGVIWLLAGKESFSTLVGEGKGIDLPDGSTVQLNAVSSIHFKQRRWSNQRTLKLEGEGFFDVKKGVPFSVVTENGTIEVLGTRFNVFARPEKFVVHCFEGQVRLLKNNQKIDLKPGEYGRWENEQWEKENFSNTSRPNWMDGEQKYVDEPLELVLQEMERQYGVLFPKNGIPPQKKYSGPMPLKDLDAALEIICGAMELDCKLDPEGRVEVKW